MTKDKINKSALSLLTIDTLTSILGLFLDTFLVAYFYNITNQNLKVISIFHMITYTVTGMCFWLLGDIVKTKNPVNVCRTGIVLHCLYILAIALLKEQIQYYYPIFAIFYGLLLGVYWSGYHVVMSETFFSLNTKRFVSLQNISSQLVKILAPIILGTSIQLSSFSNVAIAVFIIALLQFIASFFMKKIEPKNTSFNLLKYIHHVKNSFKLKNFYRAMVLNGVVKMVLSTIITLMIIMTFKTSLNLGILTSIFSGFSILSLYIFNRFYRAKNPQKIIVFSAIILSSSVIILVIGISKPAVIIYNLINSIFMVLLNVIATIQRYDCMDETTSEEFVAEHQAFTEINLAIGRLLGYSTLLLVSLFENILYLKILLLLITICIVLYAKGLYRVQKK